jgi:uncharacterized membrane protein
VFMVWILGSWKILPFGPFSLYLSAGLTAFLMWGPIRPKNFLKINWKIIVTEELIFLIPLIVWVWVKAHEPTINGLEKFMDFGITQSILRGAYFPPADMWYAGGTINYYYFGHLIMASITKLSGLSLAYGFNLMLGTICALMFSMSYAISRQLLSKLPLSKKIAGALFTAFLVTFSGNMHTIYAFTKGYWGQEDTPPPFWSILVNVTNKSQLEEGWNNYWYPNATRFIPFTIHEFPSYSFVVSDVHGHVLSIPIVLLLIALLVSMFSSEVKEIKFWKLGLYGWISGTAFMTNALDGPIYLGLLGLLLLFQGDLAKFKDSKWWKNMLSKICLTGGVFILTITPFLISFKPFVSGIAVNCPPAQLANQKIGPLIFEGVEKCQKSPLWMVLILWGFFLFCGLGMVYLTDQKLPYKKMLTGWFIFSILLIIFPEFFYFKDIYPLHFRSNTMFKLGYQVFIMMSLVSGYTIVNILNTKTKSWKKSVFLAALIPQLLLVSIYPYFSIRSYFNSLKEYQGIYGLGWLKDKYPDNLAAINWLDTNTTNQQPVILEAAGDSYTDYNQVSAFSGMPSVLGWAVHEWLWRGSYTPVGTRTADVQTMYESPDYADTRKLLNQYQVKYVVIGEMERTKYKDINETKFSNIGKPVFNQGSTTIYQIDES